MITRVDALEPDATLDEVFEPNHLPGRYQVGPFQLEAVPLPHLVPNAGIRLSTTDLVVAYTGDALPDPALTTLGASADLLIVNATRHDPPPPGQPRGMLTATEAGQYAHRACAKRLMLSHFWPGIDRAASLARARDAFPGEILAADEGQTVPLD